MSFADGEGAPTALGQAHRDTLMSQLGLVQQLGRSRQFQSHRASRPFLPPVGLYVALSERFREAPDPAIPVRDLLYCDDLHAAPGAVFRLSEEGLMAGLNAVMRRWPGHYELRDTAGIHQLYRLGDPVDTLVILRGYYGRMAA